VQQPPAQAQIASIRLKVVPVGLLEVVVIVVLEVDARAFGGRLRCRQRNNRREVVATAEEIQLDAREKCEEAEGVNEREGPCYRCSC
tara:strand:- start:22881 stop:23141 length:261 start_codon:yes stop_codon:yes gene_type:complete